MNQFLSISSGGDLAVWYESIKYLYSENTLKQGLQRWRDGEKGSWKHEYSTNNKVLIYCEYLPKEAKAKLIQYVRAETENLLGDVSELSALFTAEQGTELDIWYAIEQLTMAAEEASEMTDLDWFVNQKLWTPTQCGDLKKACGWLRILSQKDWYLRFGLRGQTRANAFAAKLIKAQNLYGFRIGNGRKLELKLEAWKLQKHNCLVSNAFGNNNGIKTVEIVTDHPMVVGKTKQELAQLAEDRLLELWFSNVGSIGRVHTSYQQEAEEFGLPFYTEMRVRQILAKPINKTMIDVMKLGKVAARNGNDVFLKRKTPSVCDLMWSIDGTTVQLWSISEDGKRIEKHLYIVVVADAKTRAIIGYSISRRETSLAVVRALRSAVDCAGYLPKAVQYDNSSANKSEEVQNVFRDMKTLGLPSEPYMPRSKYSERVIADFEMYLRCFPSWVGSNITAKKATSRANPDKISFQFKNDLIPTENEVQDQVKLAIGIYNFDKKYSKKSKADKNAISRLMAYKTLDLEHRTVASRLTVATLFWVKRKDKVTYTQNGIITEIEGVRHNYWVESSKGVESVDFRQEYAGDRFWLRYNPDNLDMIHIYDDNDKHIAEAVLKYEFEPIPTEGEMTIIAENRNNNKARVKSAFIDAENLKARNRAIGFGEVGPTSMFKDAYNDYLESEELAGLNSDMTVAMPTARQNTKGTKAMASIYVIDEEGGVLD